MKKVALVIIVIAIAAIVISLLGAAVMTNNGTPSLPSMEARRADIGTSTPPSPASEVLPVPESSVINPSDELASSAVKEFTITAENYSFAPSMMSVKKGDTVKITLKNIKGVHDLKIDEFAVATKKINGGEKDTVTFIADKSGTFEFYCSIASHRQMGMKGTLTVTQ